MPPLKATAAPPRPRNTSRRRSRLAARSGVSGGEAVEGTCAPAVRVRALLMIRHLRGPLMARAPNRHGGVVTANRWGPISRRGPFGLIGGFTLSVFYLLPPPRELGDRLAHFLQAVFPGLDWDYAARESLTEVLTAAAGRHTDVY